MDSNANLRKIIQMQQQQLQALANERNWLIEDSNIQRSVVVRYKEKNSPVGEIRQA